jgi:hypothetical protein
VPVYGLGQHADGRPYYAMRFVRGETLKEAIVRHHNPPAGGGGSAELGLRSLLGRFVAVCNTIAYAHSRGVIHRDLKPANILLGPYGETLVVDWGLAKAMGSGLRAAGGEGEDEPTLLPQLAEGSAETLAGAALGTPTYMSPEQALGRLDLLGPATDVYGLGATLYSILTGRPPVEGKDTAEILRKVEKGEVPPPRQVKPDVPAALEAVCRKAMARPQPRRYGSALEVAADVERWLADEPVSAWPEPWTARARRWGRRHRAWATAGAAVLVGLVVSMVGLTAGLFLLAKGRKAAEDKEMAAEDKVKAAEDKGEKVRRGLYLSEMNLVRREYEAGNIAHVRELLDHHASWLAGVEDPGVEDLRGFEWYYWDRLANQKALAAIGPAGRDWLLERAATPVLTLHGHAGGFVGGFISVAWSPDGGRLAGAGTAGIVDLWDAGGKKLLTLGGPIRLTSVACVAWSPDGRRLASASDNGTVRVWDAASGREVLTLTVQTGWPTSVSWSPDGRRLASAGDDGTLRLWDAASGREVLTIKAHRGRAHSVAWSPDGKRLASTGGGFRWVSVW